LLNSQCRPKGRRYDGPEPAPVPAPHCRKRTGIGVGHSAKRDKKEKG
jgi:hypothetical protein